MDLIFIEQIEEREYMWSTMIDLKKKEYNFFNIQKQK